jgi:uncharacterized protein YecT (DUF1311 family)
MKRAFPACLILLAALSAHALAMGPSPDSSFAEGTWRIIDASPVPWIKPHMLSREEAPLVEFAIAFRDGEVVGAPQISCKHAGYGSESVSIKELFPGKVPEGKEEEMAQAMGLSSSTPYLLRVDCDAGTFFVSEESGLLVFEQGEIVYTMEHSKQEGEPGYSGPSYDCTKAHTVGEKAVCFNEELSKFDRQMGAAYSRLSKTETPESFATVQSAQRGWLAFMMKFCRANAPFQPGLSRDKDIESCLYEPYLVRAAVFEDAKVLQEGTLRLEPRMRFFSRLKPAGMESDAYPWMADGPRAAAFNKYIATTLRLNRRSIDSKDYLSDSELPETMLLESRRDFSVRRFDTRIASLRVSTYDYAGGNQGTADAFSINWDIERKKPITLGDIFFKDKKWEGFVIDYCKEDLEGQEDWGEGEADLSMVKSVVTDGRNWLFDRDKAIVHFPAGNIIVTGHGDCDVEIPYDKLKPFMRPNATVL